MSVKTGKTVPCKKCGKKIYRSPKYLKRNRIGFFCSQNCFNIYFWKENNPIKSYISREKMRKTKISQHKVGSLSHCWRGNIRPLLDRIRGLYEYNQWRISTFRRDRFRCIECTSKIFLNCDHITPLSYLVYKYKIKSIEEAIGCPELWDINNGRTLCVECHKMTDTYGPLAFRFNKRHLMTTHNSGVQDE